MADATRWNVAKGNVVNFFHDTWLTNSKIIRSQFIGPLNEHEMHFTIADLFNKGNWHLDKLSQHLPKRPCLYHS